MRNYSLKTSQSFELDQNEVFDFFSKPENLERITPPNLKFKIITQSPIKMGKGQLIDYKIKISYIPMKWRTLISDYNPPHSFIDSQVKGPYSTWIHSHDFRYEDGTTIVTDTVVYRPPFYFIGDIANKIYIRTMLNKIFNYRFNKIAEIFQKKYPNAKIQNSGFLIRFDT
tara:strand:+ start:1348 stop:1857 length:510 start_codon:yes stop_codon:yes gene_type:complete